MGIVGTVVIVSFLYYLTWFGWAFWFVVAIAVNGLLGAAKAVRNPEWYVRQQEPELIIITPRMEKRVIRSLIITKVVVTCVLGITAWHLGTRAGYFNISN